MLRAAAELLCLLMMHDGRGLFLRALLGACVRRLNHTLSSLYNHNNHHRLTILVPRHVLVHMFMSLYDTIYGVKFYLNICHVYSYL